MENLQKLKNKVLNGYKISKEEALFLYKSPLEELLRYANEIRQSFCQDVFDFCTIINGKAGRCTEDCKFCAQSIHFKTNAQEHPLLSKEEILNSALLNEKEGIRRLSVVTSGRSLNDDEIMELCATYKLIKDKSNISLCASHGLLTYEHFKLLKEAGITRYHCNLETSRRFFPSICTTHTYDDKIKTIESAKKAGLSICSGTILGLGESFEDRIDMIMDLERLEVKSIPINILNPIKGTPFESNPSISYEEILRTIAVFRFIIPDGVIRLAGGRGLLTDKGQKAFLSGANGAITGDLLTTSGIGVSEDEKIIQECGFILK